MQFVATDFPGVYLVEATPFRDDRGMFARLWCRDEFAQQNLADELAQVNYSWNFRRGTLRGLHYQLAPHTEAKLVRCVRGALFDVIIDLRADSPTHQRWFGVELVGGSPPALYVPEGFAHGFVTLQDNTEVLYHASAPFTPGVERGIRWDDPRFAIQWPVPIEVISEKDSQWPDFADDER